MSDSAKLHQQNSAFFASKTYRSFESVLKDSSISIDSIPYVELSYSLCGYGYFQNYKTQMLINFMTYLKDSLALCKNLTTIKIIFNGFSIDDDSILRLLQIIIQFIDKLHFKSIWIHTTNLRQCRIADVTDLFNLIDKAGLEANCEELSIQMADWEFKKGYPSYEEFDRIFKLMESNNPSHYGFRKFRLEISSWYMQEKEAYNFLKDAVAKQQLKRSFMTSRKDGNEENINKRSSVSKLTEHERGPIQEKLDYFLNNLDYKFLNPTYPFHKLKPEFSKEDKNKHDEKISMMNEYEKIIDKTLVKFPAEYIIQLRVQAFHEKMALYIGKLLMVLPEIREYQIDMRNWHPMFVMSNLKKKLDTMVSSKKQFSLIRRAAGLGSKIANNLFTQKDGEKMLKTHYMM